MFGTCVSIIALIFDYTVITDNDPPYWAGLLCTLSIATILVYHFIAAIISIWKEFTAVIPRVVIAVVVTKIVLVVLHLVLKLISE